MSKHDDGGLSMDKTLLDYFAGEAMVACVGKDLGSATGDAEWCYDRAAAMVAEKRRREGGGDE